MECKCSLNLLLAKRERKQSNFTITDYVDYYVPNLTAFCQNGPQGKIHKQELPYHQKVTLKLWQLYLLALGT